LPKKMPNSTNIIHNFEKGPITRSLFRNGATLLFHHAVGFSGARVNINFIAGSMFEKKEERGLAHLIEHLVFKETETNYLKELEFEGAEINAYTYKENVCFEMSLLADKLEIFLPKFIQLVGSLNFSDEQFRKEKEIVIQEIKEDLDDHESMGFEYLFSNTNAKILRNFIKNILQPIA
jgi:predicted Zn-dependent peptidase